MQHRNASSSKPDITFAKAVTDVSDRHRDLGEFAAQTRDDEVLQLWNTRFHKDYSRTINDLSDEHLIEGLSHEKPPVRMQAAFALASRTAPEVVAALEQYTNTRNSHEASFAGAKALAMIGTEQAFQALCRCLDTPDSGKRNAIARLLVDVAREVDGLRFPNTNSEELVSATLTFLHTKYETATDEPLVVAFDKIKECVDLKRSLRGPWSEKRWREYHAKRGQ